MRNHVTPFVLIAGISVFSLAALVTFAVVVSQFEDQTPVQTMPILAEATMPDGTILALNAVTYGTHHRMEVLVARQHFDPFESPWRRRSLDAHTSRDGIVIWLSRRDPRNNRYLDFDWWSHCEVKDSFGQTITDKDARRHTVSNRGHSGTGGHRPLAPDTSSHTGSNRVLVVHSELPQFRSGAMATLDVFNADGDKVASLPMSNPTPQPTAEWEPESLPATKPTKKESDGELEVVLNSVRSVLHKSKRNGEEFERARFEARFEARIDGTRSNDWSVYLRSVEDVLGNEGQTWDMKLSLHEPAWRLNVAAHRRDTAEFAASEIMKLDPITLQKPGKIDLKPTRASDGVSTAEIRAVAAAGSTSYTLSAPPRINTSFSSGHQLQIGQKQHRRVQCKVKWEQRNGRASVTVDCELPHVLLYVDPGLSEHRVTVRASDDQNRPVRTHVRNHTGNNHFCFLEVEPDARQVQLEVIVHEPQHFEFFVKPPEPAWPEKKTPQRRGTS